MSGQIIRIAKFAAGFLLAPLFAAALLCSLGTTFLLVKDMIAAQGDWEAFEAQMRHYSDRLETAPDGSLKLNRAPYPVGSFLLTLGTCWIVALLLGYLLERLRRDVWRKSLTDLYRSTRH